MDSKDGLVEEALDLEGSGELTVGKGHLNAGWLPSLSLLGRDFDSLL